uniref:Uncharacterized protein n=1 Tax=Anguilla anguilla TaxID=7936 RepID=A0A0E9RNC1_ANGAN
MPKEYFLLVEMLRL